MAVKDRQPTSQDIATINEAIQAHPNPYEWVSSFFSNFEITQDMTAEEIDAALSNRDRHEIVAASRQLRAIDETRESENDGVISSESLYLSKLVVAMSTPSYKRYLDSRLDAAKALQNESVPHFHNEEHKDPSATYGAEANPSKDEQQSSPKGKIAARKRVCCTIS